MTPTTTQHTDTLTCKECRKIYHYCLSECPYCEEAQQEYIRAYYANVATRAEATRRLVSDTQRLQESDWRHERESAAVVVSLCLFGGLGFVLWCVGYWLNLWHWPF